MNYWIHRCAYEGGHEILDTEHRLTVGFSDCAKDAAMVAAVQNDDGKAFDEIYKKVYGGDIWRARWSLWYFTCEMKEGDVVVVPRDGGFTICRLAGKPILSERRNDRDIGWEWAIDLIAEMCAPRESYATTALLSRMKCRQTTLNVGDLADDIETAIRCFRDKKPFSLFDDLSESCHSILDRIGSPDHFERLILDYFTRLGAKAEILPKNTSDKVGDCDVSAVFPALRLTISVQAKKHWGVTGDWAVAQIAEYARDRRERENDDDPNWTYANWVVSFAGDFTTTAREMARKEGVVLIDGNEFCRMLVANGLGR